MKTIIAGSRSYTNTREFFILIGSVPWVGGVTEVVSGCAKGPDTMGELWAEYFSLPITKFPANWTKYGRGAGHIRNAEMAEYADALIAFWDGVSAGTANMINLAKAKGLKTHVIMV